VREVNVPSSGWKLLTAGGALPAAESKTLTQVVEVDGLRPGRCHLAIAMGQQARFSTLPDSLPGPGAPPFSVLLASCYFANNDAGVSATVAELLGEVRPDLKFLVGDQVYVDFPAFFFGVPFDTPGLARSFLGKYLRTWVEPGGYRSALREGATWLLPDDHEFWNNYPNPATLVSNTWTQGGRDKIKSVALPLFEAFQTSGNEDPGHAREFRVGRLSFHVADSRLLRERGDSAFMPAEDLSKLIAWVAHLEGPGVLVVSQPLFIKPANFFTKRVVDRTMANFDQYQELARALLAARHSVLILAGDVHFGRVATTRRFGNQQGVEIIEVVASPAALVAGGDKETPDAPERFPAESVGPPSLPVETIAASRRAGDNVATLRFSEASGVVHVKINHWYVGQSPAKGPDIDVKLF
jgi:hypothetical protein